MGNGAEFSELQGLFESAGSLPQLPKSPLRLSRMLDSTDSNSDEIESLILSDPGLTAGLLRSASSVYHARRKPVTTIKESIMVLGFRSLRSLAIALWTQSLIIEASKKSSFDSGRFTKNGSFVGFLASNFHRELGNNGSGWSPDEVYAGGVLNNISLGLLAVLHPGTYDIVYMMSKDNQWSLTKGFQEIFQHEIAELGPLAAQALGLPTIFETVIAHCDYPLGAMESFRPLACLNYAKGLADEQGFGLNRWEVPLCISGAVLEEVAIDAERLKELVGEARRHTLLHCPANAA